MLFMCCSLDNSLCRSTAIGWLYHAKFDRVLNEICFHRNSLFAKHSAERSLRTGLEPTFLSDADALLIVYLAEIGSNFLQFQNMIMSKQYIMYENQNDTLKSINTTLWKKEIPMLWRDKLDNKNFSKYRQALLLVCINVRYRHTFKCEKWSQYWITITTQVQWQWRWPRATRLLWLNDYF